MNNIMVYSGFAHIKDTKIMDGFTSMKDMMVMMFSSPENQDYRLLSFN